MCKEEASKVIEKAFPLSTVIRWASEITGKAQKTDRIQLIDLIRESLESLSNEESLENIRKWCIYSCGCSITMPKELGDPIKYKIGNKIGPVRDRTYEFMGYARGDDTEGFKTDLSYKGESPTFFDLPKQGGRLAARSLEYFTKTAKCPYLLVQGHDIHDREVFTVQDGNTDVGERIYLSQPDESPAYSMHIFKRITSVRIVGAEVNIQFVWLNSTTYGSQPTELGLLSYYDPGEEFPGFRRYSFMGEANCCYTVEVLGHLRQPELRYDNELIRGFDSGAIKNMMRANFYKSKNDIQGAQFNASLAVTSIRKKNEKSAPNTDAIDVNITTSAGSFPEVY